ncbi:uncharacterized protein [Panulirus ornatus]|uniref:uncharacterized protein isoform X2 n=1 Tax=Panulirus ornatus TaxID=150431 RepID=UPI003A83CBA3
MMAQECDSEKTPNKNDGLDALVNSSSFENTPGSSEGKARYEDRTVQVSVSHHMDCLLSAIASSRHDATQADGILIVKNTLFKIHRIVVSAFSKVLREAFSRNTSRAVHVYNVEADVMGFILDWMYGNMAILKESFLLSFLNAVRQLDIDLLQTPGILEQEKRLLAKISTQNSNAEMGDKTQVETVPFTVDPSLSASVIQAEDGKKIDLEYFWDRNSMKFLNIQDAYKIDSMRKTLEIRNKEKTHFCCCHCCEKAHEEKEGTKECKETKGKVKVIEEEDVEQSIAKRLEKYGTKIISGLSNSLLGVPAWIFNSRDISLTPVKQCVEHSSPKRGYPSSVESKSTLSRSSTPIDDDPIIIESKLSVDRVKRNLQPLLQVRRNQEQYDYNESGKKLLTGNLFDKTRTSPYPVSKNVSNQGSRSRGVHILRRPMQRVVSSGNDTPRIAKLPKENTQRNSMVSGLPQNRPQSIPVIPPRVHARRGRTKMRPGSGSVSVRGVCVRSEPLVQDISKNFNALIPQDQNERVTVTDTGNKTPPCVHARRGRPKAQPESGSGSVVYKSIRGTCGRSELLGQDTSKNFIPSILLDQNEPVNITDTGITVILADSAAEILSKPSILKHVSDSGEYEQLVNSDPSVTNIIQVSEGTPEMPSQLQHQSKELSPSSIHMESLTTQSNTESNSFLGLCSDKQSVFEGFEKTEKEVVEKSSTSLPIMLLETSGSHTFREDKDPSLKQDVESINSTDNNQEPNDAEEKCQPKSNKQKRRKLNSRHKKTYICTVCKKTFLNNISLVLHMRLHSGKKLYHCSSCEYHSVSYKLIKKHVSQKHRRTLAESEKKCKDAPLIDPSQAVDRPVKRMKDIDK